MNANYIEPGNTLAQALDLGVFNYRLIMNEWVGSSDTQDIYSFTTHQSGDLFFSIRDLSNNANIQLLDSDGNVVSGSYNPGTQVELSTQSLKPGDYYIKVYSHSPGTNYGLYLNLNTGSASSYFAGAENLGVIIEEKQIVGRVGSFNTKDLYRFTTHQLGDLDFSLTGLENNANIQLLDSNENLISGSYNPGKQDEFKTYNNLAPGDYYFKIYNNGSSSNYNLDFELRPDDAGNALNQSQDLGFVVEEKELVGWVGSTDVRDFYRFSTEQLGRLDFSLSELSKNANIQLLNSSGKTVSGSYNTGTQDEFKTYENLVSGDYYFKVYSNTPGTNYKLDFEFLPNSSTINGTNGDDLLEGVKIGDLIQGRNGNDTLEGNDGNDSLYGGAGNDTIYGGAGEDIIYAGVGDDSIRAGIGDDLVRGQNGNDTLEGQDGNDTIYGDEGDDKLHGVYGDDLLIAGEGDDSLFGNAGDDTLNGGDGRNLFYAGTGDDLLLGGKDKDTMRSDLGDDTIYGYGGQDYLDGWHGNDRLYGGDDHDQMYGDKGNDTLAGENGIDFMYGGEGRDRLYGGDNQDYLHGEEGNDLLSGDRGNDKLYGEDGNDILMGGTGNDTLIGGTGNDIFLYDTKATFNINTVGLDTIEDFGDGRDRLHLDKTTFTTISSIQRSGFSKRNEFATVNQDSQVANSNALIVFSRGTGNLFYNQNGSASGLGEGGHFVTLTDTTNLKASDFYIRN